MSDRPIRDVRGTLVYLRPLEPDDLEAVHRWFEDHRIASLMGDLPRSLARRRQVYDAHLAEEGETHAQFVICRLADDVPVGRMDLFEIDRRHGSACLGITIGDPADWNQGYGTDAVNAVVDLAFGQLRLERVWLDTDVSNARAQAAYTKAGFVREGVLRHSFFEQGRWSDDIRMAMIRSDWDALARPRSWDLAAAEVEGRDGKPS